MPNADVPGLVTPGNIDLANRPQVKNPDGSISTVRSIGVNIDGKEILIPTVIGNRVVSNAEAIAEYKRTGKHLGIFDSPEHSTAYAQQLHNDQAQQLTPMATSARRVEFGGKIQEFPADATDAEISAALNAIPATNAAEVPKAKTWTDLAVNAIPAIAGTAGAMIGGAGGTVLGFGVGGVPGAAGGAAIGTAGGEAFKQLLNRARGAEAPATMGQAASDIAVPAAIAGVSTGAIGAATQALRPVAGTILQKVGGAMESPSTIRQMAGKGVSAAGRAIDAAKAGPPTPPPKIVLDATDVSRIRDLIKAGMPQSEAVKRVWNLKIQTIMAGWKP